MYMWSYRFILHVFLLLLLWRFGLHCFGEMFLLCFMLFWVKKNIMKPYLCQVFDKFNVCLTGRLSNYYLFFYSPLTSWTVYLFLDFLLSIGDWMKLGLFNAHKIDDYQNMPISGWVAKTAKQWIKIVCAFSL